MKYLSFLIFVIALFCSLVSSIPVNIQQLDDKNISDHRSGMIPKEQCFRVVRIIPSDDDSIPVDMRPNYAPHYDAKRGMVYYTKENESEENKHSEGFFQWLRNLLFRTHIYLSRG